MSLTCTLYIDYNDQALLESKTPGFRLEALTTNPASSPTVFKVDSSPARGFFIGGKDNISRGSCFLMSLASVAHERSACEVS